MKKISTVVAKQTKNFREQKLTIGLDLGDRSSWYCVLDEAGDVLLEQKLGTTPKAMKEVLGGMPRSRIALETGMHSPWVSRLLSELGHEVIVAHARNVRLIGESRRKDDRFDVLIVSMKNVGSVPAHNLYVFGSSGLAGTPQDNAQEKDVIRELSETMLPREPKARSSEVAKVIPKSRFSFTFRGPVLDPGSFQELQESKYIVYTPESCWGMQSLVSVFTRLAV